eukprot:1966852-Pleurochrysis_carterae.AAC.2
MAETRLPAFCSAKSMADTALALRTSSATTMSASRTASMNASVHLPSAPPTSASSNATPNTRESKLERRLARCAATSVHGGCGMGDVRPYAEGEAEATNTMRAVVGTAVLVSAVASDDALICSGAERRIDGIDNRLRGCMGVRSTGMAAAVMLVCVVRWTCWFWAGLLGTLVCSRIPSTGLHAYRSCAAKTDRRLERLSAMLIESVMRCGDSADGSDRSVPRSDQIRS